MTLGKINPLNWFMVLSKPAQDALGIWVKACRNTWDFLADNFPEDLLALVCSNRLESTDQIFAAEVLGSTGLPEADAVLRNLALDSKLPPFVREGAFYGLQSLNQSNLTDVAVAFINSTSAGLKWIGNEYLSNQGS